MRIVIIAMTKNLSANIVKTPRNPIKPLMTLWRNPDRLCQMGPLLIHQERNKRDTMIKKRKKMMIRSLCSQKLQRTSQSLLPFLLTKRTKIKGKALSESHRSPTAVRKIAMKRSSLVQWKIRKSQLLTLRRPMKVTSILLTLRTSTADKKDKETLTTLMKTRVTLEVQTKGFLLRIKGGKEN